MLAAWLVAAVKDIDRLRQISTVLVRHGFGEIVGRMGSALGRATTARRTA